jgi:phosphatidylglycerophosphate synthase
MPDPKVSRRSWRRVAPALVGVMLLAYLVRRTGPSRLLEGIESVGWGLVLVIALAGLSHVVRAWAWRLTLVDAGHQVGFSRMFALRLASEAAGQIGVFGQVCGDTWRVVRLGDEVPLAARITSVTLDRMLFSLSSTVVTFAGVVSVIFLLPLPAKLALYAKIFGLVLVALVCLAVVAVHRRWAVISGSARALSGLGKLGRWLDSKRETIGSVEERLLEFFHHSSKVFRETLILYMVGQVTAVAEVYLILRLMGYHAGLTSALAIEGLTKLVNVIGLVNPGNAGTYEGGNMLLARLAHVGATAGLAMGLIRRVRALFWAGAGALCAVALSRPARQKAEPRKPEYDGGAAVILAQGFPAESVLMRVGALPVLLRAVLGAQKAGASRIVIVTESAARMRVRKELQRTRRLCGNIEWREPAGGGDIAPVLRDMSVCEDRVTLIAADRTYHPSLHRRAAEWEKSEALALTDAGQPVGIYVFASSRAISVLKQCPARMRTCEDLHEWLTRVEGAVCESVPSHQWQRVSSAEDRMVAEKKLDRWLVKPTDGVFARMNRKVSIPISRQLIKFPITPNMVSLFTLGVSFLAGAFFALGGRWNMLVGAVLSVFASILDGSDGEVARLKLQDSAFGCWLETVCDYLYYVFIFAGMMIGLLGRGPVYLVWGTLLFFGAVASFLTTAMQRHKMASTRPEQYLSLWQSQASRRRSNPFLYLGRHAEFMIRRCCLPYLVLAFAIFGATYMAFIGAAVGSNIVWPIALYSYFTFKPRPNAS